MFFLTNNNLGMCTFLNAFCEKSKEFCSKKLQIAIVWHDLCFTYLRCDLSFAALVSASHAYFASDCTLTIYALIPHIITTGRHSALAEREARTVKNILVILPPSN